MTDVSSLSLHAEQGPSRLPNILLCMTDDQGWGDTGYNGHPELKTPHLDQMAKDGLRFDRFYSAAPVCSPTRGSCLTGRHPYRYGITFANEGHLKSQEITLAEVLNERGYATGHFGKWHLGTLTTSIRDSNRGAPGNQHDFSPPWSNGFDFCFSTEAKVPTYWNLGDYERYGTHYWSGVNQLIQADKVAGDDSRLIMDQALQFIRRTVELQQPFLAVVWFHSPHKPVVSAPPYTDSYTEHKQYYGCLTAMDEQMGRLRALLANLGIENNTMLWFCSDNGPEGNESAPGRTNGLRGRKRSLYEGGIRVPGLLVWPERIKGPRTTSSPCSTSDYFPTILEVLGEHQVNSDDRPLDGVSLLPLIGGNIDMRSQPMAFESRSQLALIDNDYKIYSNDRGKTYELYNLQEDPGEKIDLAKRFPDRVAKMKQTLKSWQSSCQASLAGYDYD